MFSKKHHRRIMTKKRKGNYRVSLQLTCNVHSPIHVYDRVTMGNNNYKEKIQIDCIDIWNHAILSWSILIILVHDHFIIRYWSLHKAWFSRSITTLSSQKHTANKGKIKNKKPRDPHNHNPRPTTMWLKCKLVIALVQRRKSTWRKLLYYICTHNHLPI